MAATNCDVAAVDLETTIFSPYIIERKKMSIVSPDDGIFLRNIY
jgi:hypothetical protein